MRMCSCNACGPSFQEGDKYYMEGGEGRQGVPLLKGKEWRKESLCPQPDPCCAYFTLHVKLCKASHRPSLSFSPHLQHMKQLHGWKYSQEATGAKDKTKLGLLTTITT